MSERLAPAAAMQLFEVSSADRVGVGAKAAGLGEMRALGFEVPPGWVLDRSFLDSLLRELELTEKVALLERVLWSIKRDHSDEIAGEICASLSGCQLPPAHRAMLEAIVSEGPVAGATLVCRSSSLQEDSSQAAFPGIYRTVHDVQGAARLERAVISCCAALFEPRALAHLLHAGSRPDPFAMALVVQAQVACELAGVLFTCDPRSEAGVAMVVELIEGRGDRLASGHASPYRYEAGEPSESWRLVGVPPGSAHSDALGPLGTARLRALADVARRMKEHSGADVDVELAFETDSPIPQLLQCRPRTGGLLSAEPSDPFARAARDVRLGTGCSGGQALGIGFDRGELDGDYAQLRDRVLLVDSLTLDDYELIYWCRAVVAEQPDGKLNHLSIACRELGLPYVSGVANARRELRDRPLGVLGGAGRVYLMSPSHRPDTRARYADETESAAPASRETEFAYLPRALHELGAEPASLTATFTGMVALLFEAATRCRDRDELASFLSDRVAELTRETDLELTLELPDLTSEELGWLVAVIPGLPERRELLWQWLRERLSARSARWREPSLPDGPRAEGRA